MLRKTLIAIAAVGLIASPSLASVKTLSSSFNKAGWTVFQKQIASPKKKQKNVLTSATSLAYALTMATNAADGETRRQMKDLLGLSHLSANQFNQLAKELGESLTAGKTDEVIRMANSLWVDKEDLVVDRNFKNTLDAFYNINNNADGIVRNRAFSDPKTLVEINKWVKKETVLIDSVLEELEPDWIAVLLNALYVKGQWQFPFPTRNTRKATFQAAGKSISVDMMGQTATVNHFANKKVKAISLPFRAKNGVKGSPAGRLTLDLILPNPGQKIADTVKWLKTDYQKMVAGMNRVRTGIQIPKFKISDEGSMVKTLKAMGMKDAFSPAKARFPNLGKTKRGENIYIADVIQKTAAEMDEYGFKAAAVTAVVFAARSAVRNRFIADRPFIIALRDTETGSILFQGVINNPNL